MAHLWLKLLSSVQKAVVQNVYYMVYTTPATLSPASLFQLPMKVSMHKDFQLKPEPRCPSHVHLDSPNRIPNFYYNSLKKKPHWRWQHKGYLRCVHEGKEHMRIKADFVSCDSYISTWQS